ncbi:hypothetical protein E2C01_047148 [Portunus trituberculatus]|uniref:Uncharacterized protein n=1 Tax=Portunus trituberculatus TaxID=210409 RepID=A0A5B7G6N7_PORTR|nr:hypothetical protein [Portunus trituberculatus]
MQVARNWTHLSTFRLRGQFLLKCRSYNSWRGSSPPIPLNTSSQKPSQHGFQLLLWVAPLASSFARLRWPQFNTHST